MTQVPADRDVTTSTTSTTQLNASERAAGDAHVTRGSAFPGSLELPMPGPASR